MTYLSPRQTRGKGAEGLITNVRISAPRIAVVLFNLGGPDGPDAVRPFLENLFSDPAIIGLPWIARKPLAALIARLRRKSATANYAMMGGASPLLAETRAQARELEAALAEIMPDSEIKVFIAMRYWRPMTREAVDQVARFEPDEIVLTPLYPQFSTTTTGSSLKVWTDTYRGPGHVRTVCCWYDNQSLAQAHAERILDVWRAAGCPKARLLFSAHGLPERIVERGDPYQWQIERTCHKVAEILGPSWDWQVCYQSRVGPLQWLGPSTPEAIAAAASEGLGVIIDPIAFVSDHIETLVELDQEYAEMARELGVEVYLRAPVVGLSRVFISGLAGVVAGALDRDGVSPDGVSCPLDFSCCAQRTGVRR